MLKYTLVFSLLISLAFADVINVPGDQSSIQAGINAAADGDTVLVADGSYLENINFKGKAITVASHFLMDDDTSHISNTIIDGSSPSHPDSGSVVMFESGEDSTSVLMGFTISSGSGTITENNWEDDIFTARAGGGIFCDGSGATITNNKITGNHINSSVEAWGGGIYAGPNGSDAYIIITDNTISNNSVVSATNNQAGGSGINGSCNALLVNNTITYNSTNSGDIGAGAVAFWAEPEMRSIMIEKNHITHNSTTARLDIVGGGIDIEEYYDATIRYNHILKNKITTSQTGYGGGINIIFLKGDCIIENNSIAYNNSSDFGGGLSLRANTKDIFNLNNIVYSNIARNGAGIYSRTTKSKFINNTIVNNNASTSGGGILYLGDAPLIFNTIVWGNQASINPQLSWTPISGSPIVRYSNIEGNDYEGKGNFSIEPVFEDSRFHLKDSTACIGNGIDSVTIDNITYYAPLTDFDGKMRPDPIDYRVDIGAIESPYARKIIVGIEKKKNISPVTFRLKQNYPNPFNPKTNIEYRIPNVEHVELSIYNLLGQKVATLVNKKQTAGQYSVEWYASGFASGVYYYALETNNGFKQSKKLLLLK